jgi:hypothetical protein
MREDDSFKGSVHINHKFDSSGLNIAYEGLLLGMWNGDRKRIPYEAPPRVLDVR